MKNCNDLCIETEELLYHSKVLLLDLQHTRAKHHRNLVWVHILYIDLKDIAQKNQILIERSQEIRTKKTLDGTHTSTVH